MAAPTLTLIAQTSSGWNPAPAETLILTADCIVGDVVIVEATDASGVSDSQGNTYDLAASTSNLSVYVAHLTAALTNGVDTIIVTGNRGAVAIRVRNFDAISVIGEAVADGGSITIPALSSVGVGPEVIDNSVNLYDPTNLLLRGIGRLKENAFFVETVSITGMGSNTNKTGRTTTTDGFTFYIGQDNPSVDYDSGAQEWSVSLTLATSQGTNDPVDWEFLLYQILGSGTITEPEPPDTDSTWPAVLVTRWGEHYRADAPGQRVWFRRAPFPGDPFDLVRQLTSGVDTRPSLARTFDERTHLLFARVVGAGSDVYEMHSDSDGWYWSTPVVAFAGGTFSGQAVNPHNGAHLKAALVGKTIKASYTDPAGNVETFDFKQIGGAALVLAESDGFGIDYAPESAERVIGAFRLDGETATSDWESVSDGRYWKRITT